MLNREEHYFRTYHVYKFKKTDVILAFEEHIQEQTNLSVSLIVELAHDDQGLGNILVGARGYYALSPQQKELLLENAGIDDDPTANRDALEAWLLMGNLGYIEFLNYDEEEILLYVNRELQK